MLLLTTDQQQDLYPIINMRWLLLILLSPLSLFSQQTITDCDGIPPITYQVSYDDDKIYYWGISDGNIITTNQNEVTVQWPDSLGTYIISCFTTRFGCDGDTSYYEVIIDECEYIQLYIPNSFTPNKDGHNELYLIGGSNADEVEYLAIFNRWGEKIFESDHNEGWDGTYQGEECEMGVYLVNIFFRNNRYIRQVHLIR